VAQAAAWRKGLVPAAPAEAVVRRFAELPGVGWVRAAPRYA
jgi:hypothetical protein